MTTPEKSLALRMIVLKFVLDKVMPAQRALRDQAANLLSPKDRVSAVSPEGTPLGTITKSAPTPKAGVTDETQLADWLSAHYPEAVTDEWRILDHDAAIAVLRTHAPQLLTRTLTPAPWAVAEVLRFSAAAGRPVGPGGELDVLGVDVTRAGGTVSVRIEDGAESVIADLITSGQVALDGSVREIGGGRR